MSEANASPEPPTATEFKGWIGTSHIFGRLDGLSDYATLTAIWPRLTGGLLRAAAATALFKRRGSTPRELFVIPLDWWDENEAVKDPHDHLWHHGTATFKLKTGHSSYTPKLAGDLFDVRLEPKAFWAIAQPTPSHPGDLARALAKALKNQEPAPAPPQPTNRGRKPWPHWEDVWAEMVARSMTGEFSASIQADFEREMLGVAERYPGAPNESTIRLRAQRVWKVLPVKADK